MFVTALVELVSDFEVVFDDAVVDDGDALFGVGMGVRVAFVDGPVGCPAGVGESALAGGQGGVEAVAQVGDAGAVFGGAQDLVF